MPILSQETFIYPNDLLTEPDHVEAGRRWYVLHTRPRQEKSVAREMLSEAAPFYLPVIQHRRRAKGRVVAPLIPLFTSYLFLHGNREHRLSALKTNRLVKLLEVEDQDELWRDLRQLHHLMASGLPVTKVDRLEPGDRVEICSGPLAGLHGVVLRSATRRRFVIEVNFLQRGAAVEVDDYAIAPVE